MRLTRIIAASFLMAVAGLAVIPLLLIVSITGTMAKFAAWIVDEPVEV